MLLLLNQDVESWYLNAVIQVSMLQYFVRHELLNQNTNIVDMNSNILVL